MVGLFTWNRSGGGGSQCPPRQEPRTRGLHTAEQHHCWCQYSRAPGRREELQTSSQLRSSLRKKDHWLRTGNELQKVSPIKTQIMEIWPGDLWGFDKCIIFFSYVSVNKWQFEKLSKQTNDPCYQQASAGRHQKTKKKRRMKTTSASDTNVYFIKCCCVSFWGRDVFWVQQVS